jgi:hypothetical protein
MTDVLYVRTAAPCGACVASAAGNLLHRTAYGPVCATARIKVKISQQRK